uniref:Apelin receptor early endogenous ligand n=1 Tax=Castor canadensis TaxID=51338 RepID=A0A8C0W4C5_CASCN
MRVQQCFLVLFVFLMSLLLINGQRPANLALRRRLYRTNCPLRRCVPLHWQVSFP